VPFAVLSKPGFAAALINPATLRIGGALATGASVRDSDGDGDQDLVAQFSPVSAGVACGARRVLMTATAHYGWAITGKGTIRTTC
jgi:hypothetical protein